MFVFVAAVCLAQTLRAVTFAYKSSENLRSVNVVGQFNGWNRTADPLKVRQDGRTWSGTVAIAPGVYQYKFLLDGSTWISDPVAPLATDQSGNSEIVVNPAEFETRPGVRWDGLITATAVSHVPDRSDTCRVSETQFWVRLRTRANDIGSIHVDYGGRSWPMSVIKSDQLYETWQGTLTIPRTHDVLYSFSLTDGGPALHYGPLGVRPSSVGNEFHQRMSGYPLARPPNWVRDSIFYQVFPDRFADGDSSNDLPGTQPWGTKPTYRNWMGGDLAGIRQHLNHLTELGANALYLNPVFLSPSNHGYDTTDYFQVNPRFGSNDDLKRLVADGHALGIRTVLDGVWNHSGTGMFAFQDLLKNGASSRYRDWYFPLKFPLELRGPEKTYRTFGNSASMPKLNGDNPEVQKFVDGVATYWINFAGIDGWRLDDANEVSPNLWKQFRVAVRQAKPDTFILGEIWGDAHAWLQGDEHDSEMNYRWRSAVLDFVASDRATPSRFDKALREIRDDYPAAVSGVMYNLLGSHDTVRVLTLLKDDQDLNKMAVLIQFTYPGVPAVYYGDDIGMEGGRDPDDRRCMIWDRKQWNMGLFDFYKQLAQLRLQHAVLRRGSYRTLQADDETGIFGFERRRGNERALVYVNRSNRPRTIPLALLDGEAISAVVNNLGTLNSTTLELQPKGAIAIVCNSGGTRSGRVLRRVGYARR